MWPQGPPFRTPLHARIYGGSCPPSTAFPLRDHGMCTAHRQSGDGRLAAPSFWITIWKGGIKHPSNPYFIHFSSFLLKARALTSITTTFLWIFQIWGTYTIFEVPNSKFGLLSPFSGARPYFRCLNDHFRALDNTIPFECKKDPTQKEISAQQKPQLLFLEEA